MTNIEPLRSATVKAQRTNKVYKGGFISKIKERRDKGDIIIEENTTYAAASKYSSLGNVAVLNFANPEYPGGGVAQGGMAQEECLCRSSNLWPCLNDARFFADYYGYHRSLENNFYSDRIIYTRGVTVFKTADDIPKIMMQEDWFQVDVITCSAPCIAKRRYTNKAALKELFKSRIKNIFEVACTNKVDVLILGAFGCGAFMNPPNIVAKAFCEVIEENDYKLFFKKIVFAIKSTVNNNPFEACPNIVAFEMEFYGISMELCKRRFDGGVPIAYAFGDAVMPSGRIHKAGLEFLEYYEWREQNPYYGKQFSILGDSISTLNGFNPRKYRVFYHGENSAKTAVYEMCDTWWGKVIDFFGGELLVNNSWSGSRVTKLPNQDELFPSGCSNERTSSLHINSVMPDVIIVYLGTNDWAFRAKTGNETRFLGEDDSDIFDLAYDSMLKQLKSNYPSSEIWCCSLSETYMSKCQEFRFPHEYDGTHIEEYNDIIRSVSCKNKCKLIDLYSYKMPYDSIDGSHPTSVGMNTLATAVIRSMMETEAEQFIDCENNQHEYVVSEQFADDTKYVCIKCGKEKHESTLWKTPGSVSVDSKSDIFDESEYVLLGTNITSIRYSDTLRITIESRRKTVQIQKKEISIGRDSSSDLLFNSHKVISRHQATFLYERGMWFVRDNGSKNGTWLNGVRIQSGKKYQLAMNDVIDFAHSEIVIFDKHERS